MSLRVSLIVLVLYAGLLGLTGFGFTTSPTGFIPEQDQGYLVVNVDLPDAASGSARRENSVQQQRKRSPSKTPGVKQTTGHFRLLRLLPVRFLQLGHDLYHPGRLR